MNKIFVPFCEALYNSAAPESQIIPPLGTMTNRIPFNLDSDNLNSESIVGTMPKFSASTFTIVCTPAIASNDPVKSLESGITSTTESLLKSPRYGAAFLKNSANSLITLVSSFIVPSARVRPMPTSLSVDWYALMFQHHSTAPAPLPWKAYANFLSRRFSAAAGERHGSPSMFSRRIRPVSDTRLGFSGTFVDTTSQSKWSLSHHVCIEV